MSRPSAETERIAVVVVVVVVVVAALVDYNDLISALPSTARADWPIAGPVFFDPIIGITARSGLSVVELMRARPAFRRRRARAQPRRRGQGEL